MILDVLLDGNKRTTAEINSAVRAVLPPSPADDGRANERDNETKYDQIISNALQEGRRLCKAKLIERTSRGVFRISERGTEEVRNRAVAVAQGVKMLTEMFPNETWD